MIKLFWYATTYLMLCFIAAFLIDKIAMQPEQTVVASMLAGALIMLVLVMDYFSDG